MIIPAYKELKNLQILLPEILIDNIDLLILNDESGDGTANFIKNHKEFKKKLFLINRSKKLGYASAISEGIKYALSNNYGFIGHMDADLSHNYKDFKKLLNYKNEYQFLIGSRYIRGGKIIGWNIYRKFLSFTANFLSKKIINPDVNDFTSGMRLYQIEFLKNTNFNEIKLEGYSFLLKIVEIASKKEVVIKEVPITLSDRLHGKSNLSKKIIFEAAFLLFNIFSKKIKNFILSYIRKNN